MGASLVDEVMQVVVPYDFNRVGDVGSVQLQACVSTMLKYCTRCSCLSLARIWRVSRYYCARQAVLPFLNLRIWSQVGQPTPLLPNPSAGHGESDLLGSCLLRLCRVSRVGNRRALMSINKACYSRG